MDNDNKLTEIKKEIATLLTKNIIYDIDIIIDCIELAVIPFHSLHVYIDENNFRAIDNDELKQNNLLNKKGIINYSLENLNFASISYSYNKIYLFGEYKIQR